MFHYNLSSERVVEISKDDHRVSLLSSPAGTDIVMKVMCMWNHHVTGSGKTMGQRGHIIASLLWPEQTSPHRRTIITSEYAFSWQRSQTCLLHHTCRKFLREK